MKNLIFIVDNFERAVFFDRFTQSLKELNVTAVYLTGCYQTLEHLKSLKRDVYHIGNNKEQCSVTDNLVDVRQSIEVLSHDISEGQAVKLANLYTSNLSKISFFNDATVVAWNGHQLISLVCQSYFKVKLNYEFKFLEISNLPGKLFVDSLGVNAASTLSKFPAVIDDYLLVDEGVHTQWLLDYQQNKQGVIAQAKNIKAIPVGRIKYSLIGKARGYTAAFDFQNLIRPSWIKNKLSRRVDLESIIVQSQESISNKYVLYPMQVSSDTQILINGAGYDNDKAIQYCLDTFSKDFQIVVKPHPAEKNLSYFLGLYEKYQDAVCFVLGNTNKLIAASSHVVTINSTVGLEAMIQDVDVIVLGEALYKNFDRDRLLKYIHSFLVDDIDYFSLNNIDTGITKNVLGDSK